MRILKKTIIALSLLTIYSPSFAANNDAFAELDQATQKAKRPQSEKNQEFLNYVNQRLDEYEQWREDYTKDLDKQRQALISQWGSAETSGKTTDVEYSANDTVRKVVDYDSNTVIVSVLVDSSLTEEQAKQLVNRQNQLPGGEPFDIQNAEVSEQSVNYSHQQEQQERTFILQQTQQQMNEYDVQAERLISAGTNVPDELIYQRAHGKKLALIDEAQKRMLTISQLYQAKRKELGIEEPAQPEATLTPPAETTQMTKQPESIVTPKAPALVKSETKTATAEPVSVKKTTTPTAATKKVVSYKIKLPNNNLAKRASQYQPMALEESDKWSVDPALVMAIMHSESAFRPAAKSHVPAFGLMQIVPTSAGRDVNKQVRNIDAPMKEADLYNPPVNVETGTAYLHILNSKYLKSIKDKQSRLYCTIAAYNTGAGNVARAFNSSRSTNIRAASETINKMSPQEVYNQLINNLPYDETKNYLKKVSSRMALYQPDDTL